MPVSAPKGLALTGSILAIVGGAVALLSGVLTLGVGLGGLFLIIGLVVAALGAAAIVLGAIGCTIKPGAILTNAIICSILSLLGLLGLFGGRPNIISILFLLICATATVFLFIGFGQARRYQDAQRQ